MTGYDYYNADGISEGSLSSNTNCIPLVYNRCTLPQVRSPLGVCVNKTDCTSDCSFNGTNGTGLRDSVTGVCACKNIPTVDIDIVCNQACRKNAPKITFTSLTSINILSENTT